ncbi:MAG: hypothetical protein ACI32N_05190 [Bulleidia sp.]
MVITEYGFTEYYHKYVTFEADGLTEKCREKIQVETDDCYALCSSWIDEEGYLMFNVLSIGPTWETCTKGLETDEMLAQFTVEEVCECQARIVIPDFAMIRKNAPFIEEKDAQTDEDLAALREDERMDPLRDFYMPDIVEVTCLSETGMFGCGMRLMEVAGPFIVGEIVDVPEGKTDVSIGEKTYTLPGIGTDGMALIRLYGDDTINEDEHEMITELIRTADQIGISFDGYHMKN